MIRSIYIGVDKLLIIIPANKLTSLFISSLTAKLKKKTNMFDYILEDSFKKDIENGKYTVWIGNDICVLGEFIKYETGLITLSLTIANMTDNKAEDLEQDLKQIEKEAKAIGVNRIVLDGRKGWQKLFKDYGTSSVKLIKEI